MKQQLKRFLSSLTLGVAVLYAPVADAAEKYIFDSAHTDVVWYADHLGFSFSSGKFAKTEGELHLDEENPANSAVNVTIHTDSVVTGLEKFDAHLRSADFFNTAEYPTATFVSTDIEITGEKTATITGDFTLLGITKPVVLEATLNKIGENPFMDNKKTVGFSAETVITRSDFGMTYGLPGVGDEVRIVIEAEANIAD